MKIVQDILQDNLNNRITTALGNGVLTQLDKEAQVLVKEEAKE